jgi:hypothetical protein
MFLSPLNSATGSAWRRSRSPRRSGQLAAGRRAAGGRGAGAPVRAGTRHRRRGACLLALSTALLVFVHTLVALVF